MTSSRQTRQTADNLHRFQTDRDDALEKIQRVARILHGIHRPVVGVIDNAAVLVGLHALALMPKTLKNPSQKLLASASSELSAAHSRLKAMERS